MSAACRGRGGSGGRTGEEGDTLHAPGSSFNKMQHDDMAPLHNLDSFSDIATLAHAVDGPPDVLPLVKRRLFPWIHKFSDSGTGDRP